MRAGHESVMDFSAGGKALVRVEPGNGPFDDPSDFADPDDALGSSFGDDRCDSPVPQCFLGIASRRSLWRRGLHRTVCGGLPPRVPGRWDGSNGPTKPHKRSSTIHGPATLPSTQTRQPHYERHQHRNLIGAFSAPHFPDAGWTRRRDR